MKDLAHHLKQLNRKIIRSMHRQELEEESMELMEKEGPSPYDRKHPTRELKKIAKRQVKKIRDERTPIHKTAEERNREMKKRVPIFDRNKAKPKSGARTTHKKTPRI